MCSSLIHHAIFDLLLLSRESRSFYGTNNDEYQRLFLWFLDYRAARVATTYPMRQQSDVGLLVGAMSTLVGSRGAAAAACCSRRTRTTISACCSGGDTALLMNLLLLLLLLLARHQPHG